MHLTRQSLGELTLPVGRPFLIVWDDALKGFGVKLNAGGARQFVCQFRNPAGETKRITLGRVDSLTLDEARKAAKRTLAGVQLGADPHAAKVEAKAKATVTVRSVVDSYLAKAEERLKPRSYVETRRLLTKHWAPLHEAPLYKVRLADVAKHLDTIASERGPTAANHARVALSAVFVHAMQRGLAESNPVAATARACALKSRDHVLTDPELVAVWKSCRDDDHGRILRLLILTGLRRDEVGKMDWDEIDFATAEWTIPAARMKNKRPHVVPLSRSALDIINDVPRRNSTNLVFGVRGTGFSGWSKAKREVDARIAGTGATVKPWRLHDLRRTAATRMAETGTLPHVVEAVLSHVSGHKAGVAGVYNRAAYLPEKRLALDAWADRVEALVAG